MFACVFVYMYLCVCALKNKTKIRCTKCQVGYVTGFSGAANCTVCICQHVLVWKDRGGEKGGRGNINDKESEKERTSRNTRKRERERKRE